MADSSSNQGGKPEPIEDDALDLIGDGALDPFEEGEFDPIEEALGKPQGVAEEKVALEGADGPQAIEEGEPAGIEDGGVAPLEDHKPDQTDEGLLEPVGDSEPDGSQQGSLRPAGEIDLETGEIGEAPPASEENEADPSSDGDLDLIGDGALPVVRESELSTTLEEEPHPVADDATSPIPISGGDGQDSISTGNTDLELDTLPPIHQEDGQNTSGNEDKNGLRDEDDHSKDEGEISGQRPVQDAENPHIETDDSSAIEDLSPYSPRLADDIHDIPSAQLPAAKDHAQLRLATAAMVQTGLPLEEAAREFGVDPDALHVWHRTFMVFAGKRNLDVGDASGLRKKRVQIDESDIERFNRNWDEMMRSAELERPQISPMRRRLMGSRFTRWMFRGDTVDKVVVSGAISVVALSFLAIKLTTSDRTRPDEEPVAPEDLPAAVQKKNRNDATIQRAVTALEQFVKLPSWRDRLPFLRNSEELAPAIEEHYRNRPDGPIGHVRVNPQINIIRRKDGEFVFVLGAIEDLATQKPKSAVFLMEITTADPKRPATSAQKPEFLIDWEVLVNHDPIDWETFSESRSTEPAPFRVRAAESDYFVEPFFDRSQYYSFKVYLLNANEQVYAYASRDSEVGKSVKRLVDKELSGNRAMILNLRYPIDGKLDDVLQIDSLVCDGWLGE